MVGGDPRDRIDDGGQLGAVDGRLAAKRAEQRFAADQTGELRDIALGARGHRECDVPEHLGHGAAEAEGHDGSEGGVAFHADHELPVAGDHLLHEHRLEGVTGTLGERHVGLRHLVGRAQVEDDELCLGLVLDERADGLDGDGNAEGGREVGCLGCGVHEAAGRHGHAVGGEHLLRGGLVERRTSGRKRLLDDLRRHCEGVLDLCEHRAPFSAESV